VSVVALVFAFLVVIPEGNLLGAVIHPTPLAKQIPAPKARIIPAQAIGLGPKHSMSRRAESPNHLIGPFDRRSSLNRFEVRFSESQ
jgi:hypothetical protein